MRIEVIRASGPRAADIEQVTLALAEGARVGEALQASGLDLPTLAGYAVHGERVTLMDRLHDGDRLELLRPLCLDPKQARRRRARRQRGQSTCESRGNNP